MPYDPITGITTEVYTPSRGRSRVVKKAGRVVGYQDPDLVMKYTQPDGKVTWGRNLFVSREVAVERLTYNFKINRVQDSFGRSVGVANLGLPVTGRIAEYKTMDVTWKPLTTDPRRFKPTGNQEVVERTVFVDRNGNLRLVRTSYGRGKKYDKSKYGGRWRSAASRALGLDPGERVTTAELEKAVVKREFIVKELKPRG